ncbi:MCE family protein [Rhodococcus sp. D2-41]|nr:MCE family protein [Rhodococcus sp. D2-41]
MSAPGHDHRPDLSDAPDRTGRRRTAVRWAAAGAVAVLLAVASWFVFDHTDDRREVVAEFAYVNGIYRGSKVTVLGVPVGTVESVQPHGTTVRVTLGVPKSVTLPADVQAFVMNPSVISDRYVELSPPYRGGTRLAGGASIPVSRTHSPINWDQLLSSVNTLATALGPKDGDLGGALDSAAAATKGLGPQINSAIRDLSAATSVVGARSDDIGTLIDNVNTLVTAVSAQQGTLSQVTDDLAQLGEQIQRDHLDVAGPIATLPGLFDQLDKLLTDRGSDAAAVLADAKTLTDRFAAHQGGFAEFVDLVPLLMQNISRTIGPDQRARIRLDVSTQLTQFAVAAPLCEKYALPLCTGAGFTNPISFPISASDPLGIVSALSGRTPPQAGGR